MRCRDCGEWVDAKFKKAHNCPALSMKALFYEHRKFWIGYLILATATFVYAMMLWSL